MDPQEPTPVAEAPPGQPPALAAKVRLLLAELLQGGRLTAAEARQLMRALGL